VSEALDRADGQYERTAASIAPATAVLLDALEVSPGARGRTPTRPPGSWSGRVPAPAR
jgi:hypothetical protein